MQHVLVHDLVGVFNEPSKDFNSFSLKAECLLNKMERQVDVVDSTPPYHFQTVIASAILTKMATSMPLFSKLLLRVSTYLFKAIYSDFSAPIRPPSDDKILSAEPFLTLKTYFEQEKSFDAFRQTNATKLDYYQGLEKSHKHCNDLVKNLTNNLRKQWQKRRLQKCFQAIKDAKVHMKYGSSQEQRDFHVEKHVQKGNKKLMAYYFHQWLIFQSQKKLIIQSKTYDEMAKKESEAVTIKFNVLSRLQKVELELSQLRAEIKKRDEEIEQKNRYIFELKNDLNTRVP